MTVQCIVQDKNTVRNLIRTRDKNSKNVNASYFSVTPVKSLPSPILTPQNTLMPFLFYSCSTFGSVFSGGYHVLIIVPCW
ncbi:hypothetical protein [Ferroplasma sp.]|uniref:hypothetical protein n=1 Tax=Ferroplasma sp. TaxID=2591003 RepID=UPI00261B559E|nr:hypothetical protein [Ferroplasma sp.]